MERTVVSTLLAGLLVFCLLALGLLVVGLLARARASGAAHRAGLARQPAGVAEGAAEHELDLGVGGPHLIGRPLGQGVMDGRIEPEQDAFTVCHGPVKSTGSRCSPPAGWLARCRAPPAGWRPSRPCAPRRVPPRSPRQGARGPS